MSNSILNYDPQWKEKYKASVATASEAVAKIKPGQRIFIGTGCAEPLELVNALTKRATELPDTEIVHLLTFGEAPYAKKEIAQFFRINSFFIAENVRGIIREGLGDYTPIFLSDIPRLFNSGSMPLDVALIQVTPPDENGICSLGVSVDIVKSAAENAKVVIAQVNPNMPRTLGDTSIHILEIDVLVANNDPIIEVPSAEMNEETKQIAEYVAALVEDGATLEVGIGRIPHALLAFLKDKKELGIHTEMVTDDIIPLVESGVITGSRKTLDRNKIVASFCIGTKKLYDFVNNNPAFLFQPSEYVNDPAIISQQQKMTAINTALEIDLTGQVCTDSVGGQVDFNRAAARAHDGKAIIALPSTSQNGSVSRIVTRLSAGAGVVTTRADVHYIVTEYGVAYLHGKSVTERALALINIAHPKFRAQLLKEAIESKYLASELADKAGKMIVTSKEQRTTLLLNDGAQINFRPIQPTDEPNMRRLLYALSQQTLYYRFMESMKVIPRKQIQDFTYVDHRNDIAIVGTVPEAHGEDIIAVGRYYLNPKTNRAEVAFVVQDNWQNRGIGTFLCEHLIKIARRNGISGFTAEVLRDNHAMRSVFNKTDCRVNSKLNGDVYSYELEFV